MYKLSPYHIKQISKSIKDVLSIFPSPGQLLQDVLLDTIFSDVTLSGLLLYSGILLSEEIKTRQVKAQEVSLKLAEKMVTNRTGNNQHLALRHAIALSREMELSVDRFGDITLLQETVKRPVCEEEQKRRHQSDKLARDDKRDVHESRKLQGLSWTRHSRCQQTF